jgi:KUP system potassium uptake protein
VAIVGAHPARLTPRQFAASTVASIGVCFGDIGTSPLYAAIVAFGFVDKTQENVLGIISLILWSLIGIVAFWYAGLLMNLHYKEEGGIPALLALVREKLGYIPKWVTVLGIFGVALLYGDGAITPAISVTSAIEGLRLTIPNIRSIEVVLITSIILLAVFFIQSRGTQKIGFIMGPLMIFWFLNLGYFGARGILVHPAILQALSPYWAIRFVLTHPILSTAEVLGAVVLSMTGGEAMYADRAHFGANPLRTGWFSLTMPALVLQYLGQGAIVLNNPDVADHAFLALGPQSTVGVWYMVVLSTFATIFASQALITGVFSLTKQLRELKFLPNVELLLPDRTHVGQVYLPGVNYTLCIATIGLVWLFQTSERMASAYGLAVLGTMLCTATIAIYVTLFVLHWMKPWFRAASFPVIGYLTVLVASNATKIPTGGWIPLVTGVVIAFWMLMFKSHQDKITAVHFAQVLPDNQFGNGCYLASVNVIFLENSRYGGEIRDLVFDAMDNTFPCIYVHIGDDEDVICGIRNVLKQIKAKSWPWKITDEHCIEFTAATDCDRVHYPTSSRSEGKDHRLPRTENHRKGRTTRSNTWNSSHAG